MHFKIETFQVLTIDVCISSQISTAQDLWLVMNHFLRQYLKRSLKSLSQGSSKYSPNIETASITAPVTEVN